MLLSDEEVLELVAVSAAPEFQDAHNELRGIFHRIFLTADDGQAAVDYMQVQPHAQALLASPVVQKLVMGRESQVLDEMVTLQWSGTDDNMSLVGEQLLALDAMNLMMGLAGHRPFGPPLVGEHQVTLISMVRLFRAFGAVHRSVMMVREQKRLRDMADNGGYDGDPEAERRTEVH